MPVVSLTLKRFTKLVGTTEEVVVDRLPYLGLDIESVDKEIARVEYSPNRPDFGTDYGIARALRGLLGRETGLPVYNVSRSGFSVDVDARLASIRPHIACAAVRRLDLDEEDVRQLISLQEDLHNGLGRRRAKIAIGLHDAAAIGKRISYRAVPVSFSFVPLDGKKQLSIGEILSETDQGRQYGPILSRFRLYPLLVDAGGVVLSFPPVVNGNATKLTPRTKNMFVDVTGTDRRTVDDVLAILATTLAEMGGGVGSVAVMQGRARRVTPDLRPSRVPLDLPLVREVTGLELTKQRTIACIKRSRLGMSGSSVLVPRYRLDILHKVDIAEEVALGYGIDKITTLYPPSKQPGTFNDFELFLDRISDLMAASGMIELMTYELGDEETLYTRFGRPSNGKITVERAKSLEHSVLRDSLIPSLMTVLSSNIKEDYPQRLYEIGRVYSRDGDRISEAWHLCCLIAHSQSSYTEAKMHSDALLRLVTGREALATGSGHWAFAAGRTALVRLGRVELGAVGEVTPEAVDAFGLKVPVSGFEIDLTALHKQLK
jgi:phenylalanyl-tRNA synthetase beta chain